MSGNEFEVGRVYRATVRGVRDVIVMHGLGTAEPRDRFTTSDPRLVGETEDGWYFGFDVTDARPLVVLDLDIIRSLPFGRPEVIKQLRSSCVTEFIADQIEAQIKPPRIEEPVSVGSRVIAAQVGECDSSERLWVKFRKGASDCWIDSLEHIRSWSDLDDPKAEQVEP